MIYEQIAVAIQKYKRPVFEIRFKTRASLTGLFIKGIGYNDLNRKNFWHIVHENRIAEYEKTGNDELARIFYGDGFTKLVIKN